MAQPVYLRDIWPTPEEIDATIRATIDAEMFRSEYEKAFEGDRTGAIFPCRPASIYAWDEKSTYIKKPPYFDNMVDPNAPMADIANARVLALAGRFDHYRSHFSRRFDRGEQPRRKVSDRAGRAARSDFNSYGARRGNHEVMVRGTLANVRLRNQLAPGTEGPWTVHLPDGEQMFIYDASLKYRQEGTPLIILAGKEYGSGSSRDWAAKGVALLGVKAVIAESFERIHRTNLVGMGVLPLQFAPGETAASLGLTGQEQFTITGVREGVENGSRVGVKAVADRRFGDLI